MGTFPTTPVPAYFAAVYWMGKPPPIPAYAGVWYDGAPVSVQLSNASTATSYTVESWNVSTGGFDVVTSGALVGTETAFSIAAPSGGWKFGWYRMHGDGPAVDPVFGTSCFTSSFAMSPSSPHFQAIPHGAGQELPDFANAPVPKGCMGVGTTRAQIDHANAPATGSFTLALLESQAADWANYWTQAPIVDPARPRFLWVQFPNGSTDELGLAATASQWYLWCYCKDGTLDGSLLTVAVSASSGTACTITVAYNGSTVETWNVTSATNAQAQINAGSNYIRAFINPLFNAGPNPVNQAAAAIGNAYFNGVRDCVAALYPLGFTRFEIPRNEPDAPGTPNWNELAHQLLLGTAAVHTTPGAKSIGPGLLLTTDAPQMVAAGGFANVDEPSTHTYDVYQGSDLSYPRSRIAAFVNTLRAGGYGNARRWITEGNDVYVAQSGNPNTKYGINVRRQGRLAVQQTLLWEEGGIPRELNPFWYDVQHAFWDVPSFLWSIYGGPTPQVPMLYVLANQTWGRTYQGNYTLPVPADRFLIAQRYADNSGAATMVLQLACWMSSATITLGVGGASSLLVVDAFGNTSVVPVSSGQATIPLSDTPTYVQISPGVTANVVTVNGWPTSERMLLDATRSCTLSGLGSTLVPVDGGYLSYAAATGAGPWQNTLIWAANQPVNRAVVFTGTPNGSTGPPLTFTIDVSTNGGSTWTAKGAVDVSATATSVLMASDMSDTGTQFDTSWPQQCIFDVPLTGGPLLINGLRVNCSAASYGAAPDSASQAATAIGGNPTLWMQQLVLRG